MKKKGLIGVLTVTLLAIGTFMYSSCQESSQDPEEFFSLDEEVTSAIEATTNPVFASVLEVKIFQQKMLEEYVADETFRTMPPTVLANVATVCLRKYDGVTKTVIVDEYTANRAVYDNLPPTSTTSSSTSTQSELSIRQESPETIPKKTENMITKTDPNVFYRYEVDSATGAKVLIKEERIQID